MAKLGVEATVTCPQDTSALPPCLAYLYYGGRSAPSFVLLCFGEPLKNGIIRRR
ncbi:hypothetical protein CCACVL1_22052 [Corchorus capsularis]|uniref:Uncharacterized protein n=1 Tax=Corchorus capsularis TaxID=210143 RepID=A0A1R3H178_COCAP|nr:hypothetical protein CCACVL1_22052 [Corchorus capsularis]